MTTPESLNSKITINNLTFPMVTHMDYSNAQFGRYVILKSGPDAEYFLDRLVMPMNNQVLRT
jgi:hypothetical protein